MRITRRWLGCGAAGVGIALTALGGGCQTYYGGMTVPSPHYLKHPPQYFPPDPAFPLQRERDSMLDPEGMLRMGVAPPLPGVPGAIGAPAPGGVAPVPVNPGLPPLGADLPQLPPGAGGGPFIPPGR
jgi:hypothetical protein